MYSIKNTSNLNIFELFNQGYEEQTFFRSKYFGGIKAKYSPTLTFLFESNSMIVSDDEIIETTKTKNYFGSFSPVFSTRNGYTSNYNFKMDLGEINIKLIENYCEDTNINGFYLKTKTGEILIEGLLNLEVFTTDANGDGIDEIYLFSYQACSNSLKTIMIRK